MATLSPEEVLEIEDGTGDGNCSKSRGCSPSAPASELEDIWLGDMMHQFPFPSYSYSGDVTYYPNIAFSLLAKVMIRARPTVER
jgi:hypothetical protein